MTVVAEGQHSIFLADRAVLLDPGRELAWAENFVFDNPAYGWVLGKFVEADRENANRQFWSLGDLEFGKPTIKHAPMNMLHVPNQVVGTFVEAEMLYPKDTSAASANVGSEAPSQSPFIEALGAMWRFYFPRQYRAVQVAHDEGSLFFSMECVSETITCSGEGGCGGEFAYEGVSSPTYCSHLNQRQSRRQMNKPLFTGGALIIPPKTPAWKDARISELGTLVKEHQAECEAAYDGFKAAAPHLEPSQWEDMMLRLMDQARNFPQEKRDQLAKEGKAMPDGSFPIENEGDLKNAIRLAGNASNPSAARTHIRARAKALGLERMLPDSWS